MSSTASQHWLRDWQAGENSKAMSPRQWPEVYGLCHTFLHVALVKKHSAMRETHVHARIARVSHARVSRGWPCVFWLAQRELEKTCYKIWYLLPLPNVPEHTIIFSILTLADLIFRRNLRRRTTPSGPTTATAQQQNSSNAFQNSESTQYHHKLQHKFPNINFQSWILRITDKITVPIHKVLSNMIYTIKWYFSSGQWRRKELKHKLLVQQLIIGN